MLKLNKEQLAAVELNLVIMVFWKETELHLWRSVDKH